MPALSVQGHSHPQQQVHLEEDPAEIHHTCGSSCLLTPYEPQSGPSALADGQGLGGLCKMPCRSSGRESMMVSIWDCSLGRVPGLTGSWSFSAWVWETTRRWIRINVDVFLISLWYPRVKYWPVSPWVWAPDRPSPPPCVSVSAAAGLPHRAPPDEELPASASSPSCGSWTSHRSSETSGTACASPEQMKDVFKVKLFTYTCIYEISESCCTCRGRSSLLWVVRWAEVRPSPVFSWTPPGWTAAAVEDSGKWEKEHCEYP